MVLTYFYFPHEFLLLGRSGQEVANSLLVLSTVDHDATLGRVGREVETACVAALLRYSCTTIVHGEGLSWPGGEDSFEPLRVISCINSEGGRWKEAEEPEATRTGRERWHGHGQRRVFCRARRCLSICVGVAGGRGGALAVARRPSGRQEEQPIQELAVV